MWVSIKGTPGSLLVERIHIIISNYLHSFLLLLYCSLLLSCSLFIYLILVYFWRQDLVLSLGWHWSHHIVQNGLRLDTIFLPQSPECWIYRHMPACLVHFWLLNGKTSKVSFKNWDSEGQVQEDILLGLAEGSWVKTYKQLLCLSRIRISLKSLGNTINRVFLENISMPMFSSRP